jgi:hypothetical protein
LISVEVEEKDRLFDVLLFMYYILLFSALVFVLGEVVSILLLTINFVFLF